jgi:membrane protease YdiL (CAAX protease family)
VKLGPRPGGGLLTPEERRLCGVILGLGAVVHLVPHPLRIPAGLGSAAVVAALGRSAGVSRTDLGLDFASVNRDLRFGLVAALPLAAVAAAGALNPRAGRLYDAEHIRTAGAVRALYEAGLRIPVGTALAEETIFRGVLLGTLQRRRPPAAAAALSSLVFGLWHIGPALRQSGEAGLGLPRSHHRLLHAAGTVVATAAAGLFLARLRQATGSILAPWLCHGSVNAAGYLAGWLATASTPTLTRCRCMCCSKTRPCCAR